jgi:hypothetical protein
MDSLAFTRWRWCPLQISRSVAGDQRVHRDHSKIDRVVHRGYVPPVHAIQFSSLLLYSDATIVRSTTDVRERNNEKRPVRFHGETTLVVIAITLNKHHTGVAFRPAVDYNSASDGGSAVRTGY